MCLAVGIYAVQTEAGFCQIDAIGGDDIHVDSAFSGLMSYSVFSFSHGNLWGSVECITFVGCKKNDDSTASL